jgi:predicted dehydrogenase
MTKVAVCGVGPMGRMHAQLLKQNEAVELVAIADVQEELRQRVGTELQVDTFASGEELIDAGVAEVVWVCTPTYLHAPLSIRALRAGQHVFCEKPMALDGGECAAMIEAAQAADRRLTVGQVLRFWPEYVFLKNAIDQGTYGALETLSMIRIGGVTVGWQAWFLDEKRGGTQMFDRHIHDTDTALWLLGKPAGVTAFGQERADSGFVHCFTRYHYPGITVSAEGSADQPSGFPFTMGFHATFTDGAIHYSSGNSPTLCVYLPDGTRQNPELPNPLGPLHVGLNITAAGGYYLEGVYFLDCIARGQAPQIVSPHSAMDTVRLVRAEIESARQGGRLVPFE